MSEVFSRLWAWSSGCSLAPSCAAMFQVKDAYSVVDGAGGDGSMAFQLNLQTDDDRLLQNCLQVYNDPFKVAGAPFAVWQSALSDLNGAIPTAVSLYYGGSFSVERLPASWPTRLNPGDVVNLSFTTDATGRLVATLLVEGSAFLQVSKAPFSTYQTKGFKSVNPAMTGSVANSVAAFGAGSFEILASLGQTGDLTYGGTGYPLYTQSVVPTICGKMPAQTQENSNLKYTVLEKSNESIRMSASL